MIAQQGLLIAASALVCIGGLAGAPKGTIEALPAPTLAGPMTLEQAIAKRRSVREFDRRALTTQQIGQLCWAAQGITDQQKARRASPSAGALYPIELYVITAEGVDHYRPAEHALAGHARGDVRRMLRDAGLREDAIPKAPACFLITAVIERTKKKYAERAERYCLLEAGHVAQNLLLQATALELGAVPVGAVDDGSLARAFKLPDAHQVLYLVAVGHPATTSRPAS